MNNAPGVAMGYITRVRGGQTSVEQIAQVDGGVVSALPIDLGPATDQVFLAISVPSNDSKFWNAAIPCLRASEAVKKSKSTGETACATNASGLLSMVGQAVSPASVACGRFFQSFSPPECS